MRLVIAVLIALLVVSDAHATTERFRVSGVIRLFHYTLNGIQLPSGRLPTRVRTNYLIADFGRSVILTSGKKRVKLRRDVRSFHGPRTRKPLIIAGKACPGGMNYIYVRRGDRFVILKAGRWVCETGDVIEVAYAGSWGLGER